MGEFLILKIKNQVCSFFCMACYYKKLITHDPNLDSSANRRAKTMNPHTETSELWRRFEYELDIIAGGPALPLTQWQRSHGLNELIYWLNP